jgi:hypothetical protein
MGDLCGQICEKWERQFAEIDRNCFAAVSGREGGIVLGASTKDPAQRPLQESTDEFMFVKAELDRIKEANSELSILVESYKNTILENEKSISALYVNLNGVKKLNHMLVEEIKKIKLRNRAGAKKVRAHSIFCWLKSSVVEL